MAKLSDLSGNPDEPAFIFFPEVIELQGLEEPVRIGSRALLHRAPVSLKDGLRQLLDPYIRTRRLFDGVNPWEFQEVPTGEGAIQFKPITDLEAHRFWMVSHWRRLFDKPLELALELTDPSVTPVMALINPSEHSTGFVHSHAILNWLHANTFTKRRVVGPKQIKDLEHAMKMLIDFETNNELSFAFIHKALRDFADLKTVSRQMPLYVVGLFSIIESLLSTQQENATGKSLNYQLQKKLTLMDNRFREPLTLSDYFGKTSAPSFETVIKKLYQYRSDVAHGNVFDFAKDLAVLVNHQAVCEFLHALVRRLILQAIQEPELMRDLKEC